MCVAGNTRARGLIFWSDLVSTPDPVVLPARFDGLSIFTPLVESRDLVDDTEPTTNGTAGRVAGLIPLRGDPPGEFCLEVSREERVGVNAAGRDLINSDVEGALRITAIASAKPYQYQNIHHKM